MRRRLICHDEPWAGIRPGRTGPASTRHSSSGNAEALVLVGVARVVPVAIRATQVPRVVAEAAAAIDTVALTAHLGLAEKVRPKAHGIGVLYPRNQSAQMLLVGLLVNPTTRVLILGLSETPTSRHCRASAKTQRLWKDTQSEEGQAAR